MSSSLFFFLHKQQKATRGAGRLRLCVCLCVLSVLLPVCMCVYVLDTSRKRGSTGKEEREFTSRGSSIFMILGVCVCVCLCKDRGRRGGMGRKTRRNDARDLGGCLCLCVCVCLKEGRARDSSVTILEGGMHARGGEEEKEKKLEESVWGRNAFG